MQHFADMVHVRRLKLQCMEKLRHVEVLAGYKHLTDLDMTVSKQRDFSFVNKLSQSLYNTFYLCRLYAGRYHLPRCQR